MTGIPDGETWPECNDKGCGGKRVDRYKFCIVHLDPADREQVLVILNVGSDMDFRGVPFTKPVLERVLRSQIGSGLKVPRFGATNFRYAQFNEDATFEDVLFDGAADFGGAIFGDAVTFKKACFGNSARFDDAKFVGGASFDEAKFLRGEAHFNRAILEGPASFKMTEFHEGAHFLNSRFGYAEVCKSDRKPRSADFHSAQFNGIAEFRGSRFKANACFQHVNFGDAVFDGVQVGGDLDLTGAFFTSSERLGPLVTAQTLNLNRVRFDNPIQIEAAASAVTFQHAVFNRNATLLLRYAQINLDNALLTEPLTIASAQPFSIPGQAASMDEGLIIGSVSSPMPRLVSLVGVDCSMLVLADIDLSDCHLSRAYHVDALHIGGNCRFAEVPRGRISATGWPPIWRWSRRQTVAEEHAWRAVASHPIAWPTPSRTSNAPSDVLQPERIAVLYRQLRKALEDVKNEPGAADFYYGEMEMRRHATTISGGERFILWLYWLVSGYALRATRSLAFLVGVVAITTVLLASYGLPKSSLGAGVWPKTTRALLISLNSIIFRTAGQPLTTVGAFIELVARFTGPVLLALAIIALRNRIKR